MKIKFYHTKAYDWECIKSNEANEGDILAKNAKGDLVKRILINSNHTEIEFAGGAIEAIHNDRVKAGVSKRTDLQIIIRHLEDGVIPHHFQLDDIVDLECTDKNIEKQLKEYFITK